MNNNTNLLIEFEINGHDLNQFKIYENFLIECSKKNYTSIGTQMHHILPKGFMNGTDKKQNLIQLSYQDHYTAHLILAECFPKGDKRRGYNYGAAKLIVGWVKQHLLKRYDDITEYWEGFWEIAHKEVSELNRGENHPQYGNKLSEDRCRQMSEQRKGTRTGLDNHFFGKKHTDESRQKIREKRALQVFSDESQKKKSETMRGKNNHFFNKQHSEKSKQQISEKLKKFYQDNPKPKNEIILPEGLFRCEYIDEKNNRICNIMRYCPVCNIEIYHKIKETPFYLNGLVNRNPKCRICANNPLPVKPLKIHRESKRNKIIKNVNTEEIFKSINEFKRLTGIKGVRLKNLFESKILIVIEDNYTN